MITEVEKTSPYSSNTQDITTNAEDSILANEAENESDPIVNYVLLGDTVADGIFAWISIGVDATASYTGQAAATLTADGGVENESSGMGGGGPDGGDMGGDGGPPGSSNVTAAGWNGTASSNGIPAASGSASGTVVVSDVAGTSTSTSSGSAVSSTAEVTGGASRKRSPMARFFFF